MIGVLTHHWAKADRVDEAKKLLDGNGLAQSKAPGFVSRQTLMRGAEEFWSKPRVRAFPRGLTPLDAAIHPRIHG